MLGSLLLSLYTSPIASIAHQHGITQQEYADDTQFYVAIPKFDSAREIQRLETYLSSLHAWFSFNGLALNPDKTDAIVFGTHRCARTDGILEIINVADSLVKPTDKIKLLGVTLDNKLTLDTHVGVVCKAVYLHIRALRHIRIVLTDDTAKTVG